MVTNKGLIFKAVPEGHLVPGEHLAVEARDFDKEQAPPKGGATIKIYYVSFDPYQRGRMRPKDVPSYIPAFDLGQPIINNAVAKIIKSESAKFQTGDVIVGMLPTEEYGVVEAKDLEGCRKLENPYHLDPMLFLGPLGMPGLTAYSSFYGIAQPKRGETIFISAASGAVGQVVGQLAKHEGLKVIGSVGDDAKLAFIKDELAFDEGFNYKKEKPMDALKRLSPNGIDIYYENVGGEHLEAALANMKKFGRIGE